MECAGILDFKTLYSEVSNALFRFGYRSCMQYSYLASIRLSSDLAWSYPSPSHLRLCLVKEIPGTLVGIRQELMRCNGRLYKVFNF